MATLWGQLSQAVRGKIKQTASDLFAATPPGQLYKAVRQAPSNLAQPITPARFDIPNRIAAAFGGGSDAYKQNLNSQVPLGRFMFGSQGNLPTGREVTNAAVNYVLPALSPFSTPFKFQYNPKAIAGAFGIGVGLEGARQYGANERINVPSLLTSGAYAAPFGLLTTPQYKPQYTKTKTVSPQVVNEMRVAANSIMSNDTPALMDAKTRLRSLLTYDRDLARLGYTAKERAHMGVSKGRRILNEELPGKWSGKRGGDAQARAQALTLEAMNEGNSNWFTKTLYPIKTLSKNLQEAVVKHDNQLKVAKVEANTVARDFTSKLSPDLEWRLVQYSQDPTPQVAKRLGLTPEELKAGQSLLEKSRVFNDRLFTEAKNAKIEIGYLKNHIYQIFSQTPEQIDDVLQAKGLGRRPGFAQHRSIPTFEYGQKELGLTPKFTTFAQLNASARYALDKAMVNADLADKLLDSGQLLPRSKAPPSWVTIEAKFFPRANVRIGVDLSNKEGFAAPPPLASFLNTYFGTGTQSPASKIIQTTGDIAQRAQDVRLSSGGLTVNSFTLGQIFKDLATATGDVVTGKPVRGYTTATAGIRAMLRGFIPGQATKFEADHAGSIREMARYGHTYGGVFDYKTAFPNVEEQKSVLRSVKETSGNLWNTVINQPTFQKFLYQRKVSLYEGFRNALIRGGKPVNEAQQLAAEQLRVYDGQAIKLGRSPDVQNIMKTFFLAPTYRETVIGSGVNAIKGLIDFKNPNYSPSRSLLLGLVATYLTYDALNVKNTGRHMYENPSGRTFEVMFNDPNDPNKYYSTPWMPSSTATYRRIGEGMIALFRGDINEAVRQFSSLGSVPASLAGELISGRDYFGRDIFPESPNVLDYAKRAVTGLLPTPFDTASKTYDAYQAGKNPNLAVATAQAFELPIKQGTYTAQFYSIRDQILNQTDKQTTNVYKQLHPDTKDENRTKEDSMQDAMTRLSNFSVVSLEGQIDKATAQKLGRPYNPFYDLAPQQQRLVLWTQALPPGPDKSAIQKQNIAWLEPYWDASSRYYDQLPNRTPYVNKAPQASLRAEALMDRGIFKDFEVQAYLSANTAYKNQQRIAMGLPPLTSGYSGGGSGLRVPAAPKAIKARKLSFKKFRVKGLQKLNKIKITKVKVKKLARFKKYKLLKPSLATSSRYGALRSS